jgi:hypothetical protein
MEQKKLEWTKEGWIPARAKKPQSGRGLQSLYGRLSDKSIW